MDKRSYYREHEVAQSYDHVRVQSRSGAMTQSMEIEALKWWLPKQGKIFELACGTGRLLKILREQGYDVTGIDQSASMLEAGSLLNTPLGIVGDVHNLPIKDSSADAVYSMRFTNHYPDLLPFFKECRRVLKSGGDFVFDAMRWSPLLWESKNLGGRNYPVSTSEIKNKLKEAGFRVESVRPLFFVSPYILAHFPYAFSSTVVTAGKFLPQFLHSISIWHAKKTN